MESVNYLFVFAIGYLMTKLDFSNINVSNLTLIMFLLFTYRFLRILIVESRDMIEDKNIKITNINTLIGYLY